MAIFGKGTLGVLGQIASLLNGTISSSLRLVSNLLFGGFKMVLQFNDAAMAFSRQAGLTAKQAQAYTEVLATRAKDLGAKYGIAAEEVAKLEQNLSRATGRVLMLSSAQADMQVALNRTAGEGAVNDFTQTIMRTMGGQLSTVQGAVSKAYATAAKKGLDAAGMAAKVGQNLSMANRLTFKNGVDGITKMVALSEKLGFNMQSLESAANSFMDIQDAIESSAKLSMLGGAAGAMGGNPLDMSYEANYDPEAFGERMTKILGGYAQFDEKTGMAKMNAMSRDFVKGIADAMHISLDEATAIAKKNAEVTYKNNRFGSTLDRMAMDENGNIDENKRDFLINKSQYNTAKERLEINGKGLDYYQNDPKGIAELKDMMKFSGMSDEEIVREQAQAVLSINEKIQGWITTIQGIMAEKISPYLPKIQEFLGELYNMILPHIGEIAENVKNLIQTAVENMPAILDKVKYVVDAFGKFATFITGSWTKLLGAAFFLPIINAITNLFGGISKLFGKGKTTATPAKSKGGRPNKNYSWKQAKNYAKNAYRMSKGGVKGLWNGAKALWRNSGLVRGVAKGANVAGWLGLAADYGSDYLADKGVIEKGGTSHTIAKVAGQAAEYGALGASIGTFIGGPVGAAVGGALGAIGGGIAGYFDAQAQKEEAEKNKMAASTPATPPAQPLTPPERHSTGGAVGSNVTPPGEDILTFLKNGEIVLNEKQQRKIADTIQPTPVGGKEYIYVPQNTSTSTVGDNKITINDINVRVEGTIRLDAGNAQKDIDISKLLDNHMFVSMLADKINTAINSNINLKEMRDTAYLTGRGVSSTIVGRMMTTT